MLSTTKNVEKGRKSDLFEDVRFDAAGKFTSRGEWIHPSITIPTTEIIIVTDGHFRLDEDGNVYTLSPGDVIFLSPLTPHKGIEVTKDKVSFYWIHMYGFDPDSELASAKHFSLREPHHVSILCRQLLHYCSTSDNTEITDHLLLVLLHELAIQSRPYDSENALVAKMVEWIRINSDRKITPGSVAEKFGYNEDYITRLFKKHYGEGVKVQINEQKLGRIRRLLLESDMTLAQIADAAGFSDYKLFLKFFKYHTDMTPSEFRQVYYAIHTNNK